MRYKRRYLLFAAISCVAMIMHLAVVYPLPRIELLLIPLLPVWLYRYKQTLTALVVIATVLLQNPPLRIYTLSQTERAVRERNRLFNSVLHLWVIVIAIPLVFDISLWESLYPYVFPAVVIEILCWGFLNKINWDQVK